MAGAGCYDAPVGGAAADRTAAAPTWCATRRHGGYRPATLGAANFRQGVVNRMGSIGPTELLLIALVVVLIFGAGRIAEIGKGLGEGIRNFKKGIKDDPKEPAQLPEHDDGDDEQDQEEEEERPAKVRKKDVKKAEKKTADDDE
jgi:sec-independent protein translocase protein TatA